MEFKNIKELIRLFDDSGLSKLKIQENDFSLSLEKGGSSVVMTSAPVASAPVALAAPVAAPAPAVAPVESPAASAKGGEFITSPMVGTFYHAPSPDSPLFCKEGDIIRKGSTLCILEAMKIMNEIEAEYDCKILEVLAQDGRPVEYDMPLFRVERV